MNLFAWISNFCTCISNPSLLFPLDYKYSNCRVRWQRWSLHLSIMLWENLFELQCLINADDNQHAATNENFLEYFVAFVSNSSDLGLYYVKDTSALPVIKKVPWFQCLKKKLACLCFDLEDLWLLTTTIDGSLYIIPVKT